MSNMPSYNFKVDKRAKGVKLRVDYRGLWVVANRKLPENKIQKVISEHADWIKKHAHKYQPEKPKRIMVAGQDYRILYGSAHDFKVQEGIIEVHNSQAGYDTLVNWLKRDAKVYLRSKTTQLASIHNLEPQNIRVRDQYTRWGSCSSKGNINLNWRLLLAPIEVAEYVIIHELAHLKEMNHSQRFWSLVAHMMPDYKMHLHWLKQNGEKLHWI